MDDQTDGEGAGTISGGRCTLATPDISLPALKNTPELPVSKCPGHLKGGTFVQLGTLMLIQRGWTYMDIGQFGGKKRQEMAMDSCTSMRVGRVEIFQRSSDGSHSLVFL